MYTITTSIYALFFSFVISSLLCPVGIKYLRKLKFGQNVRDDGPESHLVKSGTPTMGGIMILVALFFGCILYINGNKEGSALLLVTLGFGAIGFTDDYIKIVKKRSLGLRAYQKIVLQIIVSTIFLFFLVNNVSGVVRAEWPIYVGKLGPMC